MRNSTPFVRYAYTGATEKFTPLKRILQYNIDTVPSLLYKKFTNEYEVCFMNFYENNIIRFIGTNTYINQRTLSKALGISLGKTNICLNNLVSEDYLDKNYHITNKSRQLLKASRPKSAIILSAGYGLRMVPINTETPKGLLTVHGDTLIERLIKQLHEVGIYKIYIVVGYLKEQYEYLIDEYDVELIVNMDYSTKNNLHSLLKAIDLVDNTYIIPCDIWCKNNPFQLYEPYTWYMISDQLTKNTTIKLNRKRQLIKKKTNESGSSMIGISFISHDDSDSFKQQLKKLSSDSFFDNSFWEEALFSHDITVYSNEVSYTDVIEINTIEQLRDLDSNSEQLQIEALQLISESLKVSLLEINDIQTLKKGMTNRSFLFSCHDKRYIMRIPGEGTGELIDRKHEFSVYNSLKGKNLCDDVIYINPDNGYKITLFFENARTCNPDDKKDLDICMQALKSFHQQKLLVDHSFDIFEQINYYESLWSTRESIYRDYAKTKEHVFLLKKYIDEQPKEYCLSHIDSVPDNFLILDNGEVRLIDWEYAGMQDPHVDIAMFCIYSLYDRQKSDYLIDLYFKGTCSLKDKIKIYCYIAACGLLWSNWCEYKRQFGIEFGEYALRQYRYAKDFYKIAIKEMENMEHA